MKSSTTPRFWKAYSDLPSEIKLIARKQYRLWTANPRHPSLQFKKVGPFWSARITENYRSLALLRSEIYHWFWIGTHAEYERILKGR
ncbi:MAG: hypothetical protein ABI042_03125 [Verrucomicrobiota bacterium]